MIAKHMFKKKNNNKISTGSFSLNVVPWLFHIIRRGSFTVEIRIKAIKILQ